MLQRKTHISGVRVFVLGALLLVCPCGMLAQHGGGHGGGGRAGGAGGSRAGGVDQGDDLKDFRRALTLQASDDQAAEYRAVFKSLDAAGQALQPLLQVRKENTAGDFSRLDAALDDALEQLRSDNKAFLNSFSRPQKSGLKDITKKLLNADSEIAKETRILDQRVGNAKGEPEQIAISTESLNKALTTFRTELLSLGTEMSIVLPTGEQELAFDLAPVQNSVIVNNQLIGITASGKISKVAAEGNQNVFKLEMDADLSDLQQNITALLRSELDKSDACGERIAIQRVTLSPSVPASLVIAQLHFELWTCERTTGKETTHEIVEGDGTITVKLTPAVERDGSLRLVPEMGSVEASGAVGEMLRSGSLGETLRERITRVLLSVIQKGVDAKATLPPSVQGSTTIASAKFQTAGLSNLNIILYGEIRISDEQTKLLASQLKERASASR
jgi:hypothetical protein